jgi:transposase
MPKLNDLSRSLVTLEQDATLIAVMEMGQSSWLVAGIVPGVERQPLKKLAVDESALLKLLNRWREEAEQAGHGIKRIAVVFEAGRDGFWLDGAPRPTGSTPNCLNAPSSGGCAASVITARWWQSRQPMTKMLESKVGSSTE